MASTGDDLTKARIIDFSVVFPSAEAASKFCESIVKYGLEAEVDDFDQGEDIDVTVSNRMVPTHAAISEFEALLEQLASPYGGRNDGWGCFAVSDGGYQD